MHRPCRGATTSLDTGANYPHAEGVGTLRGVVIRRIGMRSVRVLLFAVCALPVMAQEPGGKSTGQVGQLIPGPFPSYNVNGDYAKRVHCPVLQHELNPVIAIVATEVPQNADAPLGALLAKVEELVAKHKASKLGGFAVFLTLEKNMLADKTSEAKITQLEGMVTNLKLKEVTIGMEHPQAKPVAVWGIGAKDTVTVVLYDRHKVAARYAFNAEKPLAKKDVDEIAAAVEKMLKK